MPGPVTDLSAWLLAEVLYGRHKCDLPQKYAPMHLSSQPSAATNVRKVNDLAKKNAISSQRGTIAIAAAAFVTSKIMPALSPKKLLRCRHRHPKSKPLREGSIL